MFKWYTILTVKLLKTYASEIIIFVYNHFPGIKHGFMVVGSFYFYWTFF